MHLMIIQGDACLQSAQQLRQRQIASRTSTHCLVFLPHSQQQLLNGSQNSFQKNASVYCLETSLLPSIDSNKLLQLMEQYDILDEYYDFKDSQTYKLRVGLSSIPNGGMGLFATSSISKGEVVTQYYGSIVTAADSENQILNQQDKMVEIDKQYCVIGRGLAAKANDIVRFNPADYLTSAFFGYKANRQFPLIAGKSHNAKLSIQSKQKVMVKAIRDILVGEQIFIDYGYGYWLFYYQYANGKYDDD